MLLPLPVLVFACTQGGVTPHGPGSTPDTEETSPPSPDTSPPPVTDDTGASTTTVPPAEDDGCPSIYAQALLPAFEVEMTDADWAALQADYTTGTKSYHPAVFVYHDLVGSELRVEDAAIRLRGNPGFSWMGEKMQFNISFNEYDGDGRFLGLRKLSLDASWYDPTVLRDRVAYAYLRKLGVPASCANSATLTINGTYYGLFKNVEFVDQEYLERNFGDDRAEGGLWKYGSTLTANEEAADPVYVNAFWSHPSATWQAENTALEANIREWAGEVLIPHNDGYWCCNHNFYLYEHPADGLTFLPWDLDYTFDETPYFADPTTFYRDSTYTPHLDAVLADPIWGPVFLSALRDATEAFDPDEMATWITDWGAQTDTAYQDDLHKSFSAGERRDALERMTGFVHNRRAWMTSWLDCRDGLSDTDGDGVGPCDDCDDRDAAILPGAAETCNGRDDDCDGWVDEGAGCDTCEEHAWGPSRMMLCWEPLTWARAQEKCESYGGNLGFPKDSYDDYALWIHSYWNTTYWMGIYDWWAGGSDAAREGVWLDPTGASISAYASWASGEPAGGIAENCATWAPNSWTWADRACDLELPAVCRLE